MKQFSCGDVVTGCTATFRAATNDEILAQVGAHAARDHGMAQVPPAVVDQVLAAVRAA